MISMSSSLRIPTYVNATEFAEYIMERREGDRTYYSASTDPTVFEINNRLLASEGAVSKMMNAQWRPDTNQEEVTWGKYGYPYYSYYSAYGNIFNRVLNPPTVSLLYHPIISIDLLEVIMGDNTFTDLIASADYTEGWDGSYYIDYRNGVIEFRNFKPKYRTPIKIQYTHGRTEDNDGYVISEGSADSDATIETQFTAVALPEQGFDGKYNGKLIKFTSGALISDTYRINSSSYSENVTTFTLVGSELVTDGLLENDTYEVYSIPHDVQEMIKIYTYLGILLADPTYQHNFTNPFEEPNPQYMQIEHLTARYFILLDQRKNTIQLLN